MMKDLVVVSAAALIKVDSRGQWRRSASLKRKSGEYELAWIRDELNAHWPLFFRT